MMRGIDLQFDIITCALLLEAVCYNLVRVGIALIIVAKQSETLVDRDTNNWIFRSLCTCCKESCDPYSTVVVTQTRHQIAT